MDNCKKVEYCIKCPSFYIEQKSKNRHPPFNIIILISNKFIYKPSLAHIIFRLSGLTYSNDFRFIPGIFNKVLFENTADAMVIWKANIYLCEKELYQRGINGYISNGWCRFCRF